MTFKYKNDARKLFYLIFLLVIVFSLSQCARINNHVPEADENAIGTDGVISRYHALLNTPFSHPLAGNGYIIGIEKSPRELVGANFKEHDPSRLNLPSRTDQDFSQTDLENQVGSFTASMNDPKVMLVSHILRYSASEEIGITDTTPLYSVYSESAFGTHQKLRPETAYEDGWKALDLLETQLREDVAAARVENAPYTHLFLLSMGWNNDQFEALERYNAILQHSLRAAKESGKSFKPLTIGITWPSVWGGTSVIDVANRALHLGSYPVKARDSDEIGYGIVNHIFNVLLPRIENEAGVKTVAIGHSMGARVLSRAYYSADLLKRAGPARSHPPLMIGLQGAFSANRFRRDHQLIPPVRWVFEGEGGPYQFHGTPGGDVVLTWSEDDRANPLARFTTGAAHVGGPVGNRVFNRNDDLREKLVQYTIESDRLEGLGEECRHAKDEGKVLYLDASKIIASHGDIRNPDVGRLVWRLVDCFD